MGERRSLRADVVVFHSDFRAQEMTSSLAGFSGQIFRGPGFAPLLSK